MEEIKLSFSEKIDRALDGRKQSWVIKKMNECMKEKTMNPVRFSMCKKGSFKFTDVELRVLNSILKSSIKNEND